MHENDGTSKEEIEHYKDKKGRPLRIKVNPTHSKIKVTQHNCEGVKTTYVSQDGERWTLLENQVPVEDYEHADRAKVKYLISVTQPSNLKVEDRAYNAMMRVPGDCCTTC